jgi:hypothetical protein
MIQVMKKIKNIQIIPILMIIMMGSLSSCEKFLEEVPPARYQISTLSKPLLDAFVNGAYEPLSRSRGRLWESTLTRDIEGLAEYCQLPAGGGTNYMNYNFEPQRNDNAARWTTFYEAIGKNHTGWIEYCAYFYKGKMLNIVLIRHDIETEKE